MKKPEKLIILPGCKGQDFAIIQDGLSQTYNQNPPKTCLNRKAVEDLEFRDLGQVLDPVCPFLKPDQNPRPSTALKLKNLAFQLFTLVAKFQV